LKMLVWAVLGPRRGELPNGKYAIGDTDESASGRRNGFGAAGNVALELSVAPPAKQRASVE